MLNKKEKFILMSLIFIGLGIALKLFHIDYMINYSSESYESFCNINKQFNCDAVAASPYSYFLGIPIALYGSLANLFLLILLPLVFRKYDELRFYAKGIYLLIFGAYSLGCLALMYISFNFINSLCLLCMVYWVLSFITFFFLLYSIRKSLTTNYLKELFRALWRSKIPLILLVIFYSFLNFTIAHLLMKKNCSNPSLKSCQNYNYETNLPYLGEATGFLKITIYTDFECPYCRKINGHVEKLAEKYKDKITFIRKEFPLDMSCNPMVTKPFHKNACLAAYFAKCMGAQGQFWEFHNALYKTTKVYSRELFLDLADDFNIDLDELKSCIESSKTHKIVADEIQEATNLKIDATPSFKIFGEVLPGIITEREIKRHLASYPFVDKNLVDNIFTQKIESNMLIIDIRDFALFNKSHLLKAKNIPYNELKLMLEENDNSISAFKGDILFYGDKKDKEQLEEIFKMIEAKDLNIRLYLLEPQ